MWISNNLKKRMPSIAYIAMNIKKSILLFVLFLGTLVVSVFIAVAHPGFFSTRKRIGNIVTIPSRNVHVSVELATTPYQWGRGLMFRDSLGKDSGMLFVFPDEDKRSFWLKETAIPLDIIFIASNKKVVDIKHRFEPCRTMICPSYTATAPAMYALEVNAGFAERYGIINGDTVEIQNN